jgi:hypothetical protein
MGVKLRGTRLALQLHFQFGYMVSEEVEDVWSTSGVAALPGTSLEVSQV